MKCDCSMGNSKWVIIGASFLLAVGGGWLWYKHYRKCQKFLQIDENFI